MQYFLKNWKTTTAGILIVLMTILVQNNVLTTEQSTALMGALSAFGFINASDVKEKLN